MGQLRETLTEKEDQETSRKLADLKQEIFGASSQSIILSHNQSSLKKERSQSLGRSRGSCSNNMRGGESGSENQYFCPQTKNMKCEMFLNDLFELKLEQERMKREILNYVQTIDSFYIDKI